MDNITVIAGNLFPHSRVGEFAPYWKECFDYAEINTPNRVAMFLAQVGHESDGFNALVENLNYSAKGLAQAWYRRYAVSEGLGRYPKKNGKYLPNDLAKSIEHKPETIANLTYANRNGNGPASSGDGWKYRGRGPKQLTGKSNYREFTKAFWGILRVDFVENPDLLAQPQYGLWAAVWFWKINHLNKYADGRDVRGATNKINGGLIGLENRSKLFTKATSLITKQNIA